MSVGIYGPPIGFSAMRRNRHASSLQLEPVVRHRNVEIGTDNGKLRLRHHTIDKYLPLFWQKVTEASLNFVRNHHRAYVDLRGLRGFHGPSMQACLSRLFQHLQELEQTDGNSNRLLDWLETVYKQSRRDMDYGQQPGLALVTIYFEGLGKVLDPRYFGSHERLFQQMAAFFTGHCRSLFKLLDVEEFLKYVHALDRTRHDMRNVLASMFTFIGSDGCRELRHYIEVKPSSFRILRAQTRRALHKMDDAKKHRDYNRAVIPYSTAADNYGHSYGPMLSLGDLGDWSLTTRSHKHKLKRQFGHNVVFRKTTPGNQILYRVIGGPSTSRPYRRLHGVGVPVGHGMTYGSDLTSYEPTFPDDDDDDDDDESTVLSYLDDEYGSSSNYELGPMPPSYGDRHGHVPRRVSFGVLEDSMLHGLEGRPWDHPTTTTTSHRFESDLSDDAVFETMHRGRHGRRRSWT